MKPWPPAALLAGDLQEEHIRWRPCYRVIAKEYAGENLFDRLIDERDLLKRQEELEAAQQIADLTNPVVQDKLGDIELVPLADRMYGPGTGLIMAAFTFPTAPSRFSNGQFGCYYATKARETAIAESTHHAKNALAGSGPCVCEKTIVEANLDATLVDVRKGRPSPEGIYDLEDYAVGQAFGELIKGLNGYGIVYDSVRDRSGECVALFRPKALSNARAAETIRYEWNGEDIVRVA